MQEGHRAAEHGKPPLQVRRGPPLESGGALLGTAVGVGVEEQPVEDGAHQPEDGDEAGDRRVLRPAQTLTLVRGVDLAIKGRGALGLGECLVPHRTRRLLLVEAAGLGGYGRHLDARALRGRLVVLFCSLDRLRSLLLLGLGDCAPRRGCNV